ncbi:MAG: PP2C family protein-serine/threonine phosphatase [Bacteroidota bacterium]|nr:serine/threonine-protein phosphatase [Candidatus Kapabacteria bacterium]MCS7302592.1 serine/threonine-protein phosphatase [Candidatus Kapabacteria bacterium]MCX7936711.1 serine/threonine-protein phosphatase [Chlorobiota bacterium]MDW8074245.1 PP2C family protein-serine/threonine phosphatase [Bacteroidota bacterium]MDW8271279.1 PP2C family protein-serine/threonine phosphatase [Bacteroidota bacterium]
MTKPLQHIPQRHLYKLLDRVLSSRFESEEELLKSLVRDLVEREEFAVVGARLWKLIPERASYRLLYQYGDVQHIPDEYELSVADQPAFAALAIRRTVTDVETDAVLRERGIWIYSATGVGRMVKLDGQKFYEYVIAINAPVVGEELSSMLAIIGSAASSALQNLRHRQEREQLRRDLDQASLIQRSLLPEHTIEFLDYVAFGVSVPDRIVGGDYFDYLRPTDMHEEERLSIVISDAASKGLPAAIQALFVSGALRMGITYHTKISSLIGRLNTLIYETFPHERFVTLFYCEITPSTSGLVLYANAGHCPALHYSARSRTVTALDPTGPILGIAPQQRFSVENINMQKGDILLLVTDGVLEAQSPSGELFGQQRLEHHLLTLAEQSPRTIAMTILQDVQQFSAGAQYSDDRTIVVLKRHP